jgi:cbb3-type cytochrome oxidase cytochrome c subunit
MHAHKKILEKVKTYIVFILLLLSIASILEINPLNPLALRLKK